MLDENNIIEKSRNVVAMQCLSLSENELKIFDTYLSRINPRDKKSRYVTFSKSEYEKLLGVERLDANRLNEYVKHLMQHIITIDIGNGWDNFVLFPTAKFRKAARSENDSIGEYYITLDINHDLDSVFFDIKSLGYIRYRLKYTLKLKNKYDMKTYLFLKTYEYDAPYTFSIPLEDFKKKIECTGQSYDEYTIFNNRILKQSIARINDITDLKVTYKKPRKKSYEQEMITFTVSRKNNDKNYVKEPSKINNSNIYNLPEEVVTDENFDIDILIFKIKQVIKNADENKISSILQRVNLKYDNNKAKSPFLYYLGILKKVLEQELNNIENRTPRTSFHNFEQRDIDYEAILRKLNK